MSLDITITAPFRFSLLATKGHLSILFGRSERGLVIESGAETNTSGKLVEVWRNDHGGSINVTAFGFRVVLDAGRRTSPKSVIGCA